MGLIGIALAFLVAAGQFVPAFLALDLTFRWMNMAPAGIVRRLHTYSRRYGAVAFLCSVTAAWLQWYVAGGWGLPAAVLNGLPWWILWRFGLRKQLTFLFKDDGGRPVTERDPDR